MLLLAISGGPDSMFLLNEYKNKKNIIVCHVNYNKREDSWKDQKIVKSFCEKNNIHLEILNIKNESKGNFQSWARKIRYDFFKVNYLKYKCSKLLMAHHKDDFIETALMQNESQRKPRFFGIKKINIINGMKIKRPYVKLYWKEDILNFLKKDNIDYAIDSSNEKPIFKRNKIRLELIKKTKKEKEDIFRWFLMCNKILKKKFKKIDNQYKAWEKNEFNLELFKKFKYKNELIYILIHSKFDNIELSNNKLNSLVDFLVSPNGGKNFKLNEKIFISKKKSKIIGI